MESHPQAFKDEEKTTKLDESDYGRPEDRDPFALTENVNSGTSRNLFSRIQTVKTYGSDAWDR